MKKFLVLFLCVVLAACAFSACSKNDGKETTAKSATEEMTTDSAVIKEADAINLIQSYSDKELGLTAKQRKQVSFMVASSGVKIDKDNYIEVIAAIKSEHKEGDQVTYTFDNQGVYYIRYDGKKVMRKDMESEGDDVKYIDMKIKAVPSTTAAPEATEETSNE